MRLNQQREKMSSSCRHAGRSKTCPELSFTNSNGFLASKLLQTIANDNCITLSRRRLAVGQALGFQETGNQEGLSNNDASIFVSFCHILSLFFSSKIHVCSCSIFRYHLQDLQDLEITRCFGSNAQPQRLGEWPMKKPCCMP